MLSHVRVLSLSTHPEHKEVADIWRFLKHRGGYVLSRTDIADALARSDNLRVVAGLGHEKDRVMSALRQIFGLESQEGVVG